MTDVEKLKLEIERMAKKAGLNLYIYQRNSTSTYALIRGDRPKRLWLHIKSETLQPGIADRVHSYVIFRDIPGRGKTDRCAEYRALTEIRQEVG